MHRFARISTNIQTIGSQLFDGEEIVVSQDGVGLYDGKSKSLQHDDGRLYLTNFRLIYVDSARPLLYSCYLDLSLVRQTEYWAGLMKSSPKVTLILGEKASTSSLDNGASTSTTTSLRGNVNSDQSLDDAIFEHPSRRTWLCRVCGFKNQVSASKCKLCGIVYEGEKQGSSTPITPPARPSSTKPSAMNSTGNDIDQLSAKLDGLKTSSAENGGRLPKRDVDGIEGLSCPECTFLNHPSMFRCEICDSPLTRKLMSPAFSRSGTSTPSKIDHNVTSSSSQSNFVRLSFRKGGIVTFYNQLKTTLRAKEWDYDTLTKSLKGKRSMTDSPSTFGIDGILRTMDVDAKERNDGLEEALQDLDRLMENAQEIVSLAQTFNTRVLSSKDADKDSNNDDVTFIRTSLLKLGLLSTEAVTEDMVKADQVYHKELAKELARVLSFVMGPPPDKRGVIPLDEVFCIWNRARGVSLVSPRDVVLSAQYLSKVSSPTLHLLTFKSGLRIVHIDQFSLQEFQKTVLSMLRNPSSSPSSFDITNSSLSPSQSLSSLSSSSSVLACSCITTIQVAQKAQLSPGLAFEMLSALHDQGVLAMDAALSTDGILWWPNLFSQLHEDFIEL